MRIYPRRDPAVLNCTELYILDIELTSEVPCDITEPPAGPCVWVGTFKPTVYNIVEPVTFAWSTSLGVINGLDDAEQCTVWITSDVPEDLEVTLVVTDANGTKTRTEGFVTRVCDGPCYESSITVAGTMGIPE